MSNVTRRTKIKVCGVRTEADALMCVALGVDAIGLNFWPGTPRHVGLERGVAITAAIRGAADGQSDKASSQKRVEVIGVFVDQPASLIDTVRVRAGLDWVQLHGDESPQDLAAFLPSAYKAIGVSTGPGAPDPLSEVARYGGARILLDARVKGAMPGGTGHRFDWQLAQQVARERTLILAGGIRPDNAAEAIRTVRPAMLDVASGVESAPGVKDPAKVEALVEAARSVVL